MDSPRTGPTAADGPRPALFVPPVFPAAAVLAVTTARLLPHPPNFTPVGACALFSGATFLDRCAAFAGATLLGLRLLRDRAIPIPE